MTPDGTTGGLHRRDAIALLSFLLLACAATWPVITDMSGMMFGFPGDTFDHVWMNRWHRYAWDNGLDWRRTNLIDAPVGKDFSQLAMQPTWRWSGLALAFIGGEIFAFNFLALASFFLSGAAMYFLARHVGAGRMAAFVAGTAYMLCPYHVWHSVQHLTLAAIQWMPLYALALLRLRERPTLLRGALCGAAFALVMLENFWYGGFMLIATALFLLVSLAWKLKAREGFTAREMLGAAAAILVGAGIITPWVLPIARRSVEGAEPLWPAMQVYRRGAEDAAMLAASPLDYMRPSSNHPLWGGAFLAPRFVHEKTIYVGGVLFVLGITGLFAARKNPRTAFAAAFFAVLALTAFLLSLWPVTQVEHAVVPMFRAYARLGVLAVMSLCVLAALGCDAIARKMRGGSVALIAVLAMVVADFAYIPWKNVTDVSRVPEEYRWLAEQEGDFIVTEIPTPRFTNYDRFYQRIHGKRLLSNDRLDQAADLREHFRIENSRAPFGGAYADAKERELFHRYVRRLAGYGVKYVIVHLRDPFPENPVLRSFVGKESDVTMQWTPPQIAEWSQGLLEEVKRFDDAVAYRVVAPPVKILVCAADGRTLIIGGAEARSDSGEVVFDILLRAGGAARAEIELESDTPLEGVRREGSGYLLAVPLEGIETVAIVRSETGAEPIRLKIRAFRVSPK